ncbi:MAG: glycoside hydrolase family 15 protein [Pseudolabrys sp.]
MLSPERTDYPAIGDYGVIGDGRTLALIARDGSIDWLCLPNFDSPSVFAALVDRRKGGRFWLGMADPEARIERRYLPGTAVLETTFRGRDGVLRLTDLMPVDREPSIPGMQPLRQIIRIVEAVEGEPEVAAVFAPRPNYARNGVRFRRRGRLGSCCETGIGALWLSSDLPVEPADDGDWLTARTRLPAGSRRHFSLVFSDRMPAILDAPTDALGRKLDVTCHWWRGWSGGCRYEGPYADAVLRSVITLKLLTHAPTGAVIAAGTTSLPEIVGGTANWDYRYCWLRDASLTMQAFFDLGYRAEAEHFINWLLIATKLTSPRLLPVYTLYGHSSCAEHDLDLLEGYRGSKPVRIGNAAGDQFQLGVYGMVVEAAYDFLARGGELDSLTRRDLARFGDVVCDEWQEPDNGIWEVRGRRRHYTHSKVMCFAALDCLITLHDRNLLKVDRARFTAVRDDIRKAIESRGYSVRMNAYRGVFDDDVLDASLLMMPRVGYIAADAKRMVATHARLRAELGRDALLRRQGHGFDDSLRQEGAFGICSFWEIDYLVQKGALDEAVDRFEGLLAYANDLGLYAEELDQRSHGALGNFPQAFTHIGLINTALLIEGARSERENSAA